MPHSATQAALGAALARHGMDLEKNQVEMLARYARLLWMWNARLNLTRHTDVETFVARDVVDSLALACCLEGRASVLDIGTGGGVPGVLLAIVRPDLRLTLCDSVKKKARAVEEIVQQLECAIPVRADRAESILRRETFDTMVARAVAPLPRLLAWLRPAWGQSGDLLVIKGRAAKAEAEQARAEGLLEGLELRTMHTYRTPTTGAENVVLRIGRA